MKKAFLLVILVAFSAVCLLSLVSCGKAEEYGEVGFYSWANNTMADYGGGDSELSVIFTAGFRMARQQEYGTVKAKVANGEKMKEKAAFLSEGYEEAENAVIVSKWLYYISLPLQEAKANGQIKDEDCLQRYLIDIGEYTIKNEESQYFGKKIKEIEIEGKNAVTQIAQIALDIMAEDPIFQYGEASLVMATLAYYGFIDISKIEKGVGKLMINYNPKNITLNVVGYYESEADKLLEKAVSMDKESKEYKTVLEQLQNPTFYSVCGNFLE